MILSFIGLFVELFIAAAVASAMFKIAEFEGENPWIWSGLGVLLCAFSFFFVPWFILRMGLSGVAAFIFFMIYRIAAKRA